MPIRTDGSDGTSGYAQLTLQTGIIVDGAVIGRYLCIHENCSQKDKIPEFRMDHITMNAHVPKSRGDCDRFVRNNPGLYFAEAVHFHREPHGWVQRWNTSSFKRCHNFTSNFIDLIACVMKFKVPTERAGLRTL